MKHRRHSSSQFGAPLAWGLKATTVFLLVLVFGSAATLPFVLPPKVFLAMLPGEIIVISLLGIVAFFCVRGYTVRHRELWIQRSFWQTKLPLKDLKDAYVDADAMKKCIRTCGCAGFVANLGWFRTKKLGSFRAWVTDPARCVVMEFADRKIVVSPDDPAGFVRTLGFDPVKPESHD